MMLAAYLRQQAALPHILGSGDCCTYAADWITLCRGVDPIASCRGRYACAATAEALLAGIGGKGGLLRAAGRVLRAAGLSMTRDPQPGDVGVVVVGNLATCAIRSPRGWALRMNDGLASLPAGRLRVLAAWSV